MTRLDWPTVREVLDRHGLQAPPINPRAEAWLRGCPDLKGFNSSKPVQEWADWLCEGLTNRRQQVTAAPVFPSNLVGHAWRAQADRAEDHRDGCPVGAWLTVYVAYMHACADVIDEFRKLSGWKVSA